MPSSARTRSSTFAEPARSNGRGAKLEKEASSYVEQFRALVYQCLTPAGANPVDAGEITQEDFLPLHHFLNSGRTIRNARNTVLPNPDPEQEALQQERLRRLKAAWVALTPRQKQCLQLRVEGRRLREVAEALGISVSTVADSLERSIAKLRSEMDKSNGTRPRERPQTPRLYSLLDYYLYQKRTAGLTQEELRQRWGLKRQSHVHALVYGKCRPRLDLARVIAEDTGLDLLTVIGLDNLRRTARNGSKQTNHLAHS